MNEEPLKIAVLGPRQSGKTCLAAGLSAVNTPGFTIQSGDNSGELLAGINAALQKESWPPGNNKGDTNEINLVFQKTGKPPVPVTFLDFAGERLQTPEAFKEFAEKHLVGLSGAVVLVNPGADAFLDGGALARQEALSHYKRHYERLFAWFRDKGSKPFFVALTVTASDRLEADGDLAGRKEAVEDFVGELENILQTIEGITCRRFSVTITGHLENQAKPKLAKKRDNTSAKPFLWLLDELKWAPIRAGIWRKVRLAAWVALLCAVLWGIWTAMGKNVAEGKIESLAGDVRAALEPGKANAATKAKEKFQALKGMTNGLGKALAERKLQELELGVWRLFKKEIENAILDIEGNPSSKASPEAVLKVDRCFETFVPQYDNGAKEEYKKRKDKWASQKPEWQEQYKKQLQHSGYLKPINSVAQSLNQLAGEHGDNVLYSLLGLYGDLARVQPPGDSQKLAEEKQTVAKRLDDRTAEEFRHIAGETFKGGLSRDKAQAQAASLRERLSVWTPMTDDGQSAKEEIAKSIESMTSLSTNTWDAEQRKICENWVNNEIEQRKERSLAGQGGVWSAYQVFARTNASNPYFASIVQKRVYELAQAALESNVTWFAENGGGTSTLWTDTTNFKLHWDEVNQQFDGFRQLCREIKDDKTPLRTSWAWQFACLCMDGKMIDRFDDAFPQTLVLTQVVASVDYATDTNYTRHVPVNYEFTAFGAKINVESFNRNGSPNATACFDILPFYKSGVDAEEDAKNAVVASKNKGDGPQTKELFSRELSIPVHAFERVSLAMVATDWNNGTARHSLKPVCNEGLTWESEWPGFAQEGRAFDLSFDINRNLISHTPKALFLTFYGRVEGKSMVDCLRQAKENAKKAVAGK